MKKIFLLALAVVILAAFFASKHPDGLDKTAKVLGFSDAAFQKGTVMSGYSLPFFEHGALTKAVAGMAGVIVVFLVFGSAVYFLKKK